MKKANNEKWKVMKWRNENNEMKCERIMIMKWRNESE